MKNEPIEMGDAAIALAFSGGGFRATLFHLGVVEWLRENGWLQRVTHVYSVSGGSILAGDLAQRWSEYVDTRLPFEQVANDLLTFIRRGIRESVLGELLFSYAALPARIFGVYRPTHSSLLQVAYRRLYGRVSLHDCQVANGPQFPEFHILCTNLNTAELCDFHNSGFSTWHATRGDTSRQIFSERRIDNWDLELSKAVAASSAFPPLFEPVALSRNELIDLDGQRVTLQLTDGGVFDNLGLTLPLNETSADGSRKRLVLLCDAETHLELQVAKTFTGFVDRNVRANEVLMRNLSSRSHVDWRDRFQCCSIRDSVTTEGWPPNIQRMLGFIRTDLDSFSSKEIAALVRHGFEVARTRLGGTAEQPGLDETPAAPSFLTTEIQPAHLRWSHLRRPKLLQTRWTIFTSLLLTVYILIAVGGIVGYASYRSSERVHEIRNQIANRRSQLDVVAPGASIGVASGSGSLCCFVRDSDGGVYGVTVGHLARQKELWAQNAPVFQPGPVDGGENKRIGTLARSLLFDEDAERRQDVGIFKLDDGVRWTNEVLGWHQLAGVDDARLGQQVIAVGRFSGPIRLTVAAVDWRVILPEGETRGIVLQAPLQSSSFENLSLVDPLDLTEITDNERTIIRTRFDVIPAGDSGGIVVDSDNDAIGIIIGASNFGHVVAAPLRPALERLNVRLLEK